MYWKFLKQGVLFILTAVSLSALGSEAEHNLVRRVTVFPMKAPKEVAKEAEEAWWQVREALTENQRFLVASRNFLIQRDVFQPRSDLKPADVVILGKLLDANALVTSYLNDRILSMRVYESEYGRLLWSYDLTLHPSLPVSEQLVPTAKKLILDFIASLPYQGFVVVDPLNRTAVYRDGDKSLVKVFVGPATSLERGDTIQFIRLYHDSIKPLFNPETVPEVFAEGVVIDRSNETATVEITRQSKQAVIQESTLVRLPKELMRLRESYALTEKIKAQVGTEYFAPEMSEARQSEAEKKPLAAALTFIINLATFLLLAF